MRHLAARLLPLALAAAALAGCLPQPAAGVPTPTAAPATPSPAPAPSATPTAAAAPTVTAAPTGAAATAAPTAAPTLAPTAPAATGAGEQLLFLRAGDLAALDVASGQVITLAEDVRDFAATPDGRLLGLVRGQGAAGEIWALRRDTGELRQLTANDRAERSLSWAPDGLSLAYTSATAEPAAPPTWEGWSAWCADAEARILDVPPGSEPAPAGAERVLGAGCEPAFGPDGRRIVFATAPAGGLVPGANDNALLMVNRQGENGWRVAFAGADPVQGLLVYAPAWSPDGGQVAYQRFLGYQALVDINLTEIGSSFERSGEAAGIGAGWLLPPRFSPDGALLAVTEHNFSDARGFGGYDIWTTSVLRLGEASQSALPSGEVTLAAAEVARLPRASAAAWSPDGAALAVVLPAGWSADLPGNEPAFPDAGPGAIWRWGVGGPPEARLAEGVDFGSPLLWLPAAPSVAVNEAEVALAVPAGWGLREPTAADFWVADGPGGQILAARLVAGGSPDGSPERLFADLVAISGLDDPEFLPDGSMVRGVQGATPDGRRLVGVLRTDRDGLAAAIYLAAEERWPLERGAALGLLAASGAASGR